MKKQLLILALAGVTGSLLAAEGKDEVTAAAKKLADASSYSWKTTVKVPEGGGGQFRPGPSEGKTEKDGYIYQKSTFGDNTMEVVKKGDKGAFTNQDGEWQSTSDSGDAQGPGRFMAGMVRNLKAPADQAQDLIKDTKELKKDGDAYSGDLTEEGAKNLLRFRRGGGGGGGGPEISDAKGNAKFWVKDGVLTKYEFNVKGKVSFNGNDREVDRTTTVEVSGVGSTKVEVPEGAKKKLS
jgi:hypothetical protein